ncbi:hypothetical protein [Ureaplasma zalophigenitalium]|uniref:Uncharacterized protein n=1 Tax=Ureaplasma zalophigenitalium TaxID=907723 RepID=A0ABT3BNI2_9BACT|nr:hypothetical protein [Ureaplasma zalophigenitalium]MCV3753815.1 hypothetical protein [Ureaplasma zalophigenitalium]
MIKIKRSGVSIIVSWIFMLIFIIAGFSILYGLIQLVNQGNPNPNHVGDLKFSFSTVRAIYEVAIYNGKVYPYQNDFHAFVQYQHVLQFLKNIYSSTVFAFAGIGSVDSVFPALCSLSAFFLFLTVLIYIIMKIRMLVLWRRLRKIDRDILSLLCLIGAFLPLIFLDWWVAISSIRLYKKAKKLKEESTNITKNPWDIRK